MATTSENSLGFGGFFQTELGRKTGLGAIIALLLAIMVAIFLWSSQPQYRILFSNYSDKDGGAIVAALQQLAIPYQFSDAGNAIMVPADRLHDARLKLATQGLPKGSSSGFELMENQKLGASQFLEQVNFQRALEGELSRSINSIDAVLASRVHLAIPKPSVFIKDKQKPTASVLLNLQPGRVLERQQINGILHLVSSSVADLLPSNVTIVDQNGSLLTDNSGQKQQDQLDPTQLKYIQELQSDIVRKIISILSPVLGAENIKAEASAEIDFSTTEQAAEIYKPNTQPEQMAKRSEHIKSHNSSDVNKNAMAAGAASNQIGRLNEPQVLEQLGIPPTTDAVSNSQSNQEQETINQFEVDKTVQYVQHPRGTLKRLTVGVVINNLNDPNLPGKTTSRPLTEEEKLQIVLLIKEAMGFKLERGDSLSVVNIPFRVEDKPVISAPSVWLEWVTLDNLKNILQYLISLAVIYYLGLHVLKPLIQRYTELYLDKQSRNTEKGTHVNDETQTPPKQESDLEIAKRMAQENPRIVATVIKNWLNED